MNRKDRTERGVGRRLPAALLAALLLALAVLSALGGAGFALDLGQPCSVTVGLGSTEYAADMRTAKVVLDFYQLASLREAGEDGYDYELLAPYTGLNVSGVQDAATAEALAQEAMRIAIRRGRPVITGASPEQRIDKKDDGTALQGGLYLVLARGADQPEYVREVTDDRGNTRLVTVAFSERYEYTLAPELVSLPVRSGDEWIYDLDLELEPGQTLYDLSVSLKPERKPRTGSLEIVKTLRSYHPDEAAFFVFSVEAVFEGRRVYSDVHGLSFTAAGQDVIVIEDLPIGSEITVEEIYSGASYKLTSAARQTVTLEGLRGSVEFVNEYEETEKKGNGIINHFEYDAETGWGWTREDGN
jgi:hypothetical protein